MFYFTNVFVNCLRPHQKFINCELRSINLYVLIIIEMTRVL